MVGKTVGFICETNSTLAMEGPQWYDQYDRPILSKAEGQCKYFMFLFSNTSSSYSSPFF